MMGGGLVRWALSKFFFIDFLIFFNFAKPLNRVLLTFQEDAAATRNSSADDTTEAKKSRKTGDTCESLYRPCARHYWFRRSDGP